MKLFYIVVFYLCHITSHTKLESLHFLIIILVYSILFIVLCVAICRYVEEQQQ